MKEHLSFPREGFTSRKNDGGKFKFEQETMEIFKKYGDLTEIIKWPNPQLKLKRIFSFLILIEVLNFFFELIFS